MGLLHTATSENKIVDEGLTINYSRKLTYGKWHYWNGLNIEGELWKAWEYKRFAKKTYRYVGMDYDSACSVADTLTVNYTRDYYFSRCIYGEDEQGNLGPMFVRNNAGKKCQAQISVQKQVGHIYSVVVSIQEEDIAYSTITKNAEDIFLLENTRTYDF